MRIFNTGQISPSEKQDILDKHRTLYNGFRTMEPKVSNEQPLYIQDFAGDKLGMTINNKGEVKKYTNFGINERIEEGETCEQCGGQMNEGICEQCGSGEMDVFLHASGGYRTVNRRHSVSANLEDAGRGTGNIDSA